MLQSSHSAVRKRNKMIPSDYLEIYIADTTVYENEEMYKHAYEQLPLFRRERVDAYKHAASRCQSVAAFMLLMDGLRDLDINPDWDNIGYQTGENGKPYFESMPEIHFNLSHTDGRAMCVISSIEVGCDIENIREGKEKLASRFFAKEEKEKVKDALSFTKIWTMKESYIKQIGLGLAKPLNEFDVFTCKPRPQIIYETDSFAGAICTPIEGLTLEKHIHIS